MDTGQRSAYEFVLTLKSLCTQTLCNPLSTPLPHSILPTPPPPSLRATAFALCVIALAATTAEGKWDPSARTYASARCAYQHTPYATSLTIHRIAHRHQARPLPLARFTRALPSSNRATGPQLDPCLHLRSERFGHRGVNPVAPQRDCRQVEPRARPVRRAEH